VKDTIVILNPASRGARTQRLRDQVEKLAGEAIVRATSGAGEAERLARNAALEGYKKIVAAGGDGTINEIVNGIAGHNVTLGVLPIGTMNVFATELGLPLNDLGRCWKIIQQGRTHRVDLPRANRKHFVQLAGVGLDAQAVKETSGAFKRSFGPLSYLISAVQVASRTPPVLRIESKDAVTVEGSFVLVGNGRLYGGRFPFFKQAVMNDGLLDVIVFKRLSYLDIIRYLQDVVFTPQISSPEVEYFKTKQLRVSSDEIVPVEIDGELIGNCPVEFRIRAGGLRVLTPH